MTSFFKYISLLVIVGFLNACKQRTETITIQVTPLTESSLYNADEVIHYIEKHKDTNKELALDYYSKSAHTLITPQEKTTYYLKRSLSLYPNFDNYLELGHKLCESNNYKEMNDLYRMLVFPVNGSDSMNAGKYVFYKPTESVVIEYVISNILAYNVVWNSRDEQLALTEDLGIKMDDIKEKVLSDPRIKISKPTAERRSVLWDFLTSDEKLEYYKDASSSSDSLLHIEDTATIFEINKNTVQQFIYRGYYSALNEARYAKTHGSYRESINEGFKKLISELHHNGKHGLKHSGFDYNFERSFSFNDVVNVFIYAIDTSATACPMDMRCIYHRLVTTTKTGDIIEDTIVAMQIGEQLSTLKFNHNKFTITYYKRYWEKPFTKNDFDNHLLNKTEELGDVDFEITPTGNIEKIRKPHRD